MRRTILALLALAILALAQFSASVPASAATCFWVGGTGTWDNSTDSAHWSSSSGGTGSTCAGTGGHPGGAGDIATFDGSSGGGTVTVNTNMTIQQIICGAFTGTIDWSANNNSATFGSISGGGFSCSGTGTRTINLGSGTFTIGSNGTLWDFTTTTGLTFNAGTSTIVLNWSGVNGNVGTFIGGGQTFHNISVGPNTNGLAFNFIGNNTFNAFAVTAPVFLLMNSGSTQTVQTAFTWTGSSGNEIFIRSSNSVTKATISATTGSTMTWAGINSMAFTNSTVTATNSFDLKNNSGVTITAPSTGGGGGIIGGYLLRRDLAPASNDNRPVGLPAAA